MSVARIHHVGHLVRDMQAALTLYRRLGFHLPAPAYPALPPTPGAPPRPVGAANVHASFKRNFLELATTDTSRIPAEATIAPLDVPPERLAAMNAAIARSTGNLTTCLKRFEGLHILVLQSDALDALALRLGEAGVVHGGVHAVKRGPQAIRFLELGVDGLLPEGRIGFAELIQEPDVVHPNGAVELVECIVCASDEAMVRRYALYLGREPEKDGARWVFALDGAQLTLVLPEAVSDLLPGERAPQVPSLVGYAVRVRDLEQTKQALSGFSLRPCASGLLVPSREALGAAILFR